MVLRQWSAMSYERTEEKEKQLKAEVEKLLAQAAETDAAEDGLYGKGSEAMNCPPNWRGARAG